jgi:hypothetical protein
LIDAEMVRKFPVVRFELATEVPAGVRTSIVGVVMGRPPTELVTVEMIVE